MRRSISFALFALSLFAAGALLQPARCAAEDWGVYALVPASAPGMELEVVGAGTAEGSIVSIGKPTGTPNQKWIIVPKANGLVAIRPSYSTMLVLAAEKGGKQNGTQIVLEKDVDSPWQLWKLNRNDDGTYCIVPQHAPDKGIDDFGGKQAPGSRQDLWQNTQGDPHLHWSIKPLAGTLQSSGTGAEYPVYTAPEIKPEAILKGETKNFVYKESKIFPGTVRDVTVFIPAQYNGSKPACVFVRTDGYSEGDKSMIETMIATGEMPVTIGVFVRPGGVPAPMPGTMGRRNRGLEYDGVGDLNARFFAEELLPYIARTMNLKISTSGADRCIIGGSSGGITAFNAAFERPDLFTRVYCASGSFVAFRGAHELPTLVRKVEARPIRAFMTTGTNDMVNCAGDWFLLDQEMDKALSFSGYDHQFRIVNGGHVAGYGEYLREALAYIWKGWPKPVAAGPSAPRAQDIILPGEGWTPVDAPAAMPGGPACDAVGNVFYPEKQSGKLYRIDPNGVVGLFARASGHADALTVGADGVVYSVSTTTGLLCSYDTVGKMNVSVNDVYGRFIMALPTGGFYVTGNGPKPDDTGSIWFVKDGKKSLVGSGMKLSTGLAYRPDRWLLSVADGSSKWVYSYQMNPDGTLTNPEKYFWLHVQDWDDDAGAGSVCYSKEGRQFIATRFGVQISADDGPTQVILPVPDRSRVLGVCLGGRDQDMLYAFCANHIWKRPVKVHAMGAFTPWVSVGGPPL